MRLAHKLHTSHPIVIFHVPSCQDSGKIKAARYCALRNRAAQSLALQPAIALRCTIWIDHNVTRRVGAPSRRNCVLVFPRNNETGLWKLGTSNHKIIEWKRRLKWRIHFTSCSPFLLNSKLNGNELTASPKGTLMTREEMLLDSKLEFSNLA